MFPGSRPLLRFVAVFFGTIVFAAVVFHQASSGFNIYGHSSWHRWLLFALPAPLGLLLFTRFRRLRLHYALLLGFCVCSAAACWARFGKPFSEASAGSSMAERFAEVARRTRVGMYYLFDFWLLERSFDSTLWRSANSAVRWPRRLHMASDALCVLDGRAMHRNEVYALLGKPDLQGDDLVGKFPESRCDDSKPRPDAIEGYNLLYLAGWNHVLWVEFQGDKLQTVCRGVVHYF